MPMENRTKRDSHSVQSDVSGVESPTLEAERYSPHRSHHPSSTVITQLLSENRQVKDTVRKHIKKYNNNNTRENEVQNSKQSELILGSCHT